MLETRYLLIKTATFVVMIQGSSCLYAGPIHHPENRETTVLLRPKDLHRPSLTGLVAFVAVYFNCSVRGEKGLRRVCAL